MDMTLTVRREDLILQLQEKRDELLTAAEADIEPYRVTASQLMDDDGYLARVKEWHENCLEALENDKVKITNGTIRGMPKKPGRNTVTLDGFNEWDLNGVNRQIDQLEKNRDALLAKVDAALKLLNVASNDVVEVGTAEYNQLLSLTWGMRHYF